MAKKSKPVKKATKSSVRKGATKKKSASSKPAAKRSTVKKRTPKKKSVSSKTTTKKKPVAKNRTTKKAIPNKKSVALKAAVLKAVSKNPARSGGKIRTKRTSPASIKKGEDSVNDVMTTLRTLTKENVTQPPVEEQPAVPVVEINEPENTDDDPAPWVEVDNHISVEDNKNAQEVNPAEPKPFDKFTPKAAVQEKLHFSSKPKGSVKPAGKKPLWNK